MRDREAASSSDRSARSSPSDRGNRGAVSNTASLQGLKILAVDDETDARELLTEILQVCGASVTAVGSAHEAVEALKRRKPNILLSDIGMPDEDGYSLIRQIRVLDAAQGGQTIAIALTVYARTEDQIRALETGFQMHIAKPIVIG